MFKAEGSLDNKQHLNLSDYAYEIIHTDMRSYGETASVSGFINRVIESFWDRADASISIAGKRKCCELEALLNDIPDSAEKNHMIERIVDEYTHRLLEQVKNYPKGKQLKFRLNNSNYEMLYLEKCPEESYYSSQGQYIKAILEEYARKTPCEREGIFYYDRLADIQDSIEREVILVVKTMNDALFEVKPYAVMTDTAGLYHYLVGLSESIKYPENPPKVASFRISRLKRIKQRAKSYRSGKITASQRAVIESQIQSKGVQFLLADNDSIAVRLTEAGVRKFQTQLHLRPVPVAVEGNLYRFNCTNYQAEYYFFKFGKDAVVLEPESLRERFKNNYKAAFEQYEDSE